MMIIIWMWIKGLVGGRYLNYVSWGLATWSDDRYRSVNCSTDGNDLGSEKDCETQVCRADELTVLSGK